MSLSALVIPYPGERLFGAERSLLAGLSNLDRGRVAPTAATLGETALSDALRAAGVPCAGLAPGLRVPAGERFAMWRYAPALPRLVGLIRRLRPDVLYGHSNDSILIGAPAARLCGVPFAWSPRCSHADIGRKRGPIRAIGGLGVAAVLAPSRAVERSVAWIDATLRRVVYTGVDCVAFSPGARDLALRARLGAGPGTLLVVTLGQLSWFKGSFDFVRAAGACRTPNLAFALVGTPVRPEIPGALAAAIRDSGVQNRITVHDYTDDAVTVLRAADILCVPSRWSEGLGRVIPEAQAVGVPVVATRVGGIPEVVEHDVTGLLVPPTSPGPLADAIDALAADPARRARLAAAGRRQVEARFSAEAYGRALGEALEATVQSFQAARARRAA